jgi:MraZ protein
MYLIGRYYHALEQKGRLSVPKSFRETLGKEPVLTQGLEGCLFLFSKQEWETTIDGVVKQPLTTKKSRDWARYLSNTAVVSEPDNLGRILIPDYMQNFAKLTKRVVVVGSLNRVEIWDQEVYHNYLDQVSASVETIVEGIEVRGE